MHPPCAYSINVDTLFRLGVPFSPGLWIRIRSHLIHLKILHVVLYIKFVAADRVKGPVAAPAPQHCSEGP
jgi:hypothetical protein